MDEEVIATRGDAELVQYGWKKVVKLNGGVIDKERIHNYYEAFSPSGDVLMVGLALGIFYKTHKESINSMTTVEINQDIIDLYNDRNEADDKHTIIQGDGLQYIQNTENTYDWILIDFMIYRPGGIPQEFKDTIEEAHSKLNTNGKLVIPKNNFTYLIPAAFSDLYSADDSDKNYLILTKI